MKYETILKSGDAGVEDTICLMREFVNKYSTNPQIKSLVKKLKANNDGQTLKNCLRFVNSKIRYKNDPETVELVKSVKHTILGSKKYGDCDDLCTALATLLSALDYKVYFRTVAWRQNQDDFSHVYCLAYMNDQNAWIVLDPTMSGGVGFGKEVKYHRKKDWRANGSNASCWIR